MRPGTRCSRSASVGRKGARWKDARRVLPANGGDLILGEQGLEVPELCPSRVHRDVATPQQAAHTDALEACFQHAAVHTAAREIDVMFEKSLAFNID